MTQHPEEGALHAYIDGELSQGEASALELHVGECVRCAAALAEARGYAAAASRVITTLDAAPALAAVTAPVVVGDTPAPARRGVRPPIFRVPYARAAALLLLVGGTAVVVDRTGTFERETGSQAESALSDAVTGTDLAATETNAGAMPPIAEASEGARETGIETSAAQVRPTGVVGGAPGNVAQKAAPSTVTAGAAVNGAARRAERSAPAAARAAAPLQTRDVATGAAVRDAVPTELRPTAVPSAPPSPRTLPPSRAATMDGIIVTGVSGPAVRVSRYRTGAGAILTLTEEPLRTSFAEESVATRQSAVLRGQEIAAAAMAAPAINTYRWLSAEKGLSYTLTGPLPLGELEALSKRLSELERLP